MHLEPGGAHVTTWNGMDEMGHRSSAGIYPARLEGREETRTVRLIRTR